MNLMLMTAIAVSVAGAIAFLATATASPSTRRRSEERRRRYVSRHPGLVNLGDVERRLADELPAHHHDFVLARIARQKIDAHTLWSWLDRFGAETLVLALAADSGYAGLLRRLRGDHLDREELELFAGFNHPELFALRNRTFV
ncbi:hypothetical protein [Nocardioides caricicola]|uniref:Uncharacterized protein n=1 Tax=Nocardioides caricicola TaxID=634770 RepID=A0ABW0N319_9ACTN